MDCAGRRPRCSSSSPRRLRISAETLYVRAGILNLDDSEVRSVELAVLADTGLTERQKQSLLDVYQSFRAANAPPQTAAPPQEETDMAKHQQHQANKVDPIRPFYAAVGAVDIAVAFARTGMTEAQTRLAKVDFEPKALAARAAP